MERVYEELDKVKAENEKLRADYKSKAELCDNLKKTHREQLIRIQEASSKVEKQAQELIEKGNEISEVKQLFEDLKRNLIEKESIIKRLSAANDKLRVDSDEKNRKWEEGNRGLVLALDEANEKNIDQEQKINVFKAEIEGLKGLLSASQKKCLEAERKAKASKELRERDDVLLKLEEDNRKVKDQLKWKKEQFKHLEEAHAKLQDQFKASKKEWEQERSTLVEEICSLQTSLDSQTRISGDLQNRLQMCNHALAHEESRRKCLEVQVSEFRTRFESTFAEYQDAKLQFECLTDQRDRDIAALRHSLGTKEIFYKEMEYRAGKLESENQELLSSLKELQEAQIHSAGSSSSVAKLRNKLRNVEQVHRDCSVKLRAKEAEWSSQLEKLDRERNDYRSELEGKDAALEELKIELESCQSLTLQLKMQNEEISVMLLVLKAAVSEAELKLAHVENDRDLHNKEREEHVSLLMTQLEMKTAALSKAQTDIEEEREKTTSLLRRIESSYLIEEQGLLMQKELDRYKEMLDESAKWQFQLKEKALQIESEFKEKLREVCDALDSANLDLAKEREKTASLSRAVESFNRIEEQRFPMQKELEKYKEMLEESSRCQIHLKEQVVQMECDSEEKLREVCDALDAAKLELAEQREKAACLSRRVNSLDHIEEQNLLMQKELEKYTEMLEESSRCQIHLKEQIVQMECDSKEKLREVCDALDAAKLELAEQREKAACLSRRVNSLDHIEEQNLLMQKELEKYTEMLEESSRCQIHLKEQIVQMECDSKEKLREVCDALDAAKLELAEQREKAACLSRRVNSLDHIEEQNLLMQKELEKYTEMLEESSRCQIHLKEQIVQMECDSKEKLREVCDALDAAKLDLAEQREKAACLSRRVNSLDHIEEQNLLMQKELERYKERLDESSRCQLRLQEQALVLESDSKEKLKEVCGALDSANSELVEVREKAASLSRRVESLDHIEEQWLLIQKEHERCKEMFEESSRRQLHLEEQALLIETDSKRKLKEVCDALDAVDSELAEKISDGHQIEFELWIWKSIAERLKGELEESHELRKELEASLLAQVEVGETFKQKNSSLVRILEDKDNKISNLLEQMVLLEQELKTKELEAASYARMETEKESLLQITREKDKILEDLRREIEWLEQESLRRELESALLTQIGAEQSFEHEKENLTQLVEEKDSKIDDLLQAVRSLEQKFNSSLNSFSSQLAEKQAEMNVVLEAWDKISAAEILAMLEIEEKKLMIVELEDEICNVQQKLELQEISVSHSKQQALEIEAELESKQLEIKNLTNQLEAKLTTSDAMIDELKSKNRNLLEDMEKLLSERENVLSFMGGLGDRIGEFYGEDMLLMGNLGRLVQSFSNRSGKVLEGEVELLDSVKENMNCHHSPTTKKLESLLEERSPFRQLN